MRIGQLAIALVAGSAMTAGLLLAAQLAWGPGADGGTPAPGPAPGSAQEAASEPVAAVELPPAPLPDTIRNVAPDGILPPPPVSGPLTRVASRAPERPVQEVPEEISFRRPVVLDAGTLRMKRLTVRLAGLDAPALAETCPSRLGGTWPCGMRARTALRAFVRRRAVTCEDMVEIAPGLVSARCRRQDEDLSAWMVQQGWARPGEGAGAEMRAAAEAARDARKGIWQLEQRPPAPTTKSAAPAAATPEAPFAGEGDGLEDLGGGVDIVDTPWFPGAQMPDEAQPADP